MVSLGDLKRLLRPAARMPAAMSGTAADPVAVPPAPSAGAASAGKLDDGGERHHATVVFSDLTGYAALNDAFDPEEVETRQMARSTPPPRLQRETTPSGIAASWRPIPPRNLSSERISPSPAPAHGAGSAAVNPARRWWSHWRPCTGAGQRQRAFCIFPSWRPRCRACAGSNPVGCFPVKRHAPPGGYG